MQRLDNPVQPLSPLSAHELLSNPWVQRVQQQCQRLRGQAYLVGGAVRDAILSGSVSPDLDFAVINLSAKILAETIAKTFNGRYILLDEENGIHRVVFQNPDPAPDATKDPVLMLDISDALNNNIEDDLARRDLTLNAMAIDLETQGFLDPFNGLADLMEKRIQVVSEANLIEDPLRILRIFRFAAQLNTPNKPSTLTPETLALVQHHQGKLLTVAPERIQAEWLKLLSASWCFPALKAMTETGLLELLFPEFTPMKAIPPNGHHHLGLFEHTLELVFQAEQLWQTLSNPAQSWLLQKTNAGVPRLALVKFACLLHDIGKPETMAIRDDGRFTFYGHDQASETLTGPIAQRLKLSRQATERLKRLTRWHLYPCHFGPESPTKSVLRFFRRIGDDVPDLLWLSLADRYSTRGPEITDTIIENARVAHHWLIAQYFESKANLSQPPLLNGAAVMRLTGLKPGPAIGQILTRLQEAQTLGEITTTAQAETFVLQSAHRLVKH